MKVFSVVILLQVDLDEPVTLQCPLWVFFSFCFMLYFIVIPVSVTLFATRKIPYPLLNEPFMHFMDLVFSNTHEK